MKLTQTFIDTHVAIWLYEGNVKAFSKLARHHLDRDILYYSPIIVLEMEYLFEIDALSVDSHKIMSALTKDFALKLSENSFIDVCKMATKFAWTRDVFDRMIVAEAMAANAKLITKDEKIHAHYKKAIW